MGIWAAVVLAVSGAPGADPNPATHAAWQLEWTAPDSCPQADAMQAAVAARVPVDLRHQVDTVHARGSIVRVPNGFVLRLELNTPEGTRHRTARDSDCKTLADAAALIVALAVRSRHAQALPQTTAEPAPDSAHPGDAETPGTDAPPLIAPETPTSPTGPTSATAPTFQASPTDPDSPATLPPNTAGPNASRSPAPQPVHDAMPKTRSPKTRSTIEAGLRAAAGPRIGLLPQVGLELELASWLAVGAFRGELSLSWQQARAARFAGTPTQGADIGAWSVGPSMCGVPQIRRWHFPLCAGALVGGLYARGVGLVDNGRDHLVWGAAAAGASVEYSIRPWLRLFAGAHGRVAFTRPRFTTNVRGEVHQASRVSANILLGANFVLTRRNRAQVSN